MKQAITTSTIFKAILAFTILFAAFLSVAIIYNKVYKLKNQTISIIEKYEGVTTKSLSIINNYLRNSGYDTTGNCEIGDYGVSDLNKTTYEKVASNKKEYYYCLSYYCSSKGCKISDKKSPNGNTILYKTRLFFKFNLPIFGELTTFNISGETKEIKLYDESQKIK